MRETTALEFILAGWLLVSYPVAGSTAFPDEYRLGGHGAGQDLAHHRGGGPPGVVTKASVKPAPFLRTTRKTVEVGLEWITGNYEPLKARVPSQQIAYLPLYAMGCSGELLDMATSFFSVPDHQVPGMDTQLARTSTK